MSLRPQNTVTTYCPRCSDKNFFTEVVTDRDYIIRWRCNKCHTVYDQELLAEYASQRELQERQRAVYGDDIYEPPRPMEHVLITDQMTMNEILDVVAVCPTCGHRTDHFPILDPAFALSKQYDCQRCHMSHPFLALQSYSKDRHYTMYTRHSVHGRTPTSDELNIADPFVYDLYAGGMTNG